MKMISLKESVSEIVDNRGKTCPTAETGMALIATNCVKSDYLYPSKEKVRYINEQTYSEFFRGHPVPGDLIFVTKGSPGQVCMVPDEVDFCIAQDMVALRANPKIIYPKYLFAILRSKEAQFKIRNLHVGSMIPHFKKSDFDKLEIPLVNQSKQQFIGDFYYSISKKIERNTKMNETLEDIAKTLFKSWFIDFDPVRAKAEGKPTGLSKEISDLFPDSFEDSELGEIPDGFKVDSVDNQYDISIGKTPPRKEPQWFSENQQDIPWASIKDMGDADVYINKTSEFLTNEAIEKLNIRVIPKNNVILSFKLTVGRVAILQKDMCTNEAIAHFVPKDNDLSEVFTYCLLKSIRYESLSSTSSIATAVNSKIIKAMKCIFPSKALLIAFNEFCHPIYKKIETNTNEIETLISLRDALLPKLISGELKIPDAENFIEEAGI